MPTTTHGAPYPAPGDPNDIPGDLQALAEWADDRLGDGLDLGADIGPLAPGKRIIFTSPNGLVQRAFGIDNDGTLVGGDPEFGFGYQAEILGDNPISYWRLGEASGTTTVDLTGANNGTYAGGVTLGVTGLVGDSDTAASFDGANDHVVVKSTGAILSGLANWTIEAVVNIDATGVVYSERGSSGLDILNIEVGGAGKIKLIYRDHAGSLTEIQSSNSLISPGTPHHIAITKAGTAVKFYVDGVLDGTVTLTASDTFGEATTQSWIGADATGGSWFDGVVDEVALYDTTLTSTRISAHVEAM